MSGLPKIDSNESEKQPIMDGTDTLTGLSHLEIVPAPEASWADAEAVANRYGLPLVSRSIRSIDTEVLSQISPEFPSRFGVVPLDRTSEGWFFATVDPTRVGLLDDLEALLDAPVHLSIAPEEWFQKAMDQVVGNRQMLREVSEDMQLHLVRETDEGEELLSLEGLGNDRSPIIRLVDSTLMDAFNKRASDIHIESSSEGVLIKYRVDGVLFRASEPLDMRFQDQVISRIKVMSELDISERRIPQDGRFKVRLGQQDIDFRVSIMPSIFGEDAVIRILDKQHLTDQFHGLSLEALGIHDREKERVRRSIREPYGMILVTGPTGSGKTTTLYAALSEIDREQEKIITIEDPVEYQVPGVVQIPVNEAKGLTFARGLRSILRHDPDKIMVGEIRDSETAQIAIQSALTGHLVLTTVHANNVFDVLGRFLHMGIEAHQFVSSLNCVLAQRLIRILCPHCKEPYLPPVDLLQESNIPRQKVENTAVYRAKGCAECHRLGYHGRHAIVEMLVLNDHLRDLIRSRAGTRELKLAARSAGTVFLRDAAEEKWLAGETTLEEINRVTFADKGEENK